MAKTKNTGNGNDTSSCLNIEFPITVNARFPGDLEYIPAIRKFVAELLSVSGFDSKFSYRSEIIVDEICNNAVAYGCRSENAEIELINTIHNDRIEFTIQDQGGTKDNVRRLKSAITSGEANVAKDHQHGLGLEIVRMLSERLEVVIDEENLTSIHIVRKREDDRDDTRTSST
jgi:anti-sigma regulatory factor (Ser/Thr protein kinase)